MLNSRIARIAQLLLGGSVLVATIVMVRMHRVDPVEVLPAADPKGAARVYEDRMKATRRLLQTEQLEVRHDATGS